MKRLSYQIYLTIVVCLIAFVVLAGFAWQRSGRSPPVRHAFEVAGELAAAALPDARAKGQAQEEAVERLARRLRLDLGLYSANRDPIAIVGRHLPRPPHNRDEGGFLYGRGGGPAWAVALPDGRWLVARAPRRRHRHPVLRLIFFLSGIALVVALASWPVVRGLTRRLERLQEGVESFGEGNLSARVDVRGRDEIARLAGSFNRSAERIDKLVGAHKLLLANASHELRTPLARIRLATELLKENADPQRKRDLEKDIGELDQLIEEILLLSRLDALSKPEVSERIDMLALCAEEAARFEGSDVAGDAVDVMGDGHLLRRMVRNLLENAKRHGKPPIRITVAKAPEGNTVVLSVSDNGEGINSEYASQVFEPFHRGAQRGASDGTGLGLALVRQIAVSHGGTASVTTGEDGRTLNRVLVTLPVA